MELHFLSHYENILNISLLITIFSGFTTAQAGLILESDLLPRVRLTTTQADQDLASLQKENKMLFIQIIINSKKECTVEYSDKKQAKECLRKKVVNFIVDRATTIRKLRAEYKNNNPESYSFPEREKYALRGLLEKYKNESLETKETLVGNNNCNIKEGEEKTFLEVFKDEGLARCIAYNVGNKGINDFTTLKKMSNVEELSFCSKITKIYSLGCLPQLKKINFSDNKITSITSDDFKGLINLQVLNLRGNQITSIEPESFKELKNLEHLTLMSNQITNISSKSFSGLSNLKSLNLWANKITSIEPKSFFRMNQLRLINLRNNQIKSLHANYFNNLSNLGFLNLSENQITSIETESFVDLSNLQELYLQNNKISSIDSGDFNGLVNLEILNLGNNQITNIRKGDFLGLTNLEKLYLANNKITGIESEDFTDLLSLRRLFLDKNPVKNISQNTVSFLKNLEIFYIDSKETLLSQ